MLRCQKHDKLTKKTHTHLTHPTNHPTHSPFRKIKGYGDKHRLTHNKEATYGKSGGITAARMKSPSLYLLFSVTLFKIGSVQYNGRGGE